MTRLERMKSILTQEFKPIQMELRDDSLAHAGHAGASPSGETHYTLTIQSEKFKGLSKVACHQMIYKLLGPEFQTGLHALSIVIR